MNRKNLIVTLLVFVSLLTGCATVPLAPVEQDTARKSFTPPPSGTAGLYIFRNSNFGGALKKSVYIDGELIGETAPMTYFYRQIAPGEHRLSTESEFSNNDLVINTSEGRNYFVRQAIKMGVFVGGAKLEMVSEDEGRQGVLECKLAQ